MPATPDFDSIARQALARMVDTQTEPQYHPPGHGCPGCVTVAAVTEQLRLIWNARGAADLVTLEAALSSLMGVTAAGPYVKNLDRALRSLDR